MIFRQEKLFCRDHVHIKFINVEFYFTDIFFSGSYKVFSGHSKSMNLAMSFSLSAAAFFSIDANFDANSPEPFLICSRGA